MFFCLTCKREVVGIRESERTEAVFDLVNDPVMGWVLGTTPRTWRSRPAEIESLECGCGRFALTDLEPNLQSGNVVEMNN